MTQHPFSFSTALGSRAGVEVVKIKGPLTLNNLFGFQEAFRDMKPPILVVDLSGCDYMDSAGLGLIMNQFVSAERGKRQFFLAGVSDRIQALLDLTRVSGILRICATVAAAEAVV